MAENNALIKPSAYGLNYVTDNTVSLRKERMVNNRYCSDITFTFGRKHQPIYAHKLYLATASEYFYNMFSRLFDDEDDNNELLLMDTDPEVFLMVLRIIYGAKVDINDENIRDIYDCMQDYRFTEFTQPLSDFLITQIVDNSALTILKQNDYYNLLPVHERCMHFIQNNPLHYFSKQPFLALEESCLAKIFASKQINCSYDQLNNALERWERSNSKTDTKELRKLIKDNVRQFYSHKLPILGQIVAESQHSGKSLPLKLESIQKLSLYGLGLYIKSKSEIISISLVICNVYTDKERYPYRFADYTISNTNINALQIVDLMFEEVSLYPNQEYSITLLFNSRCDKYMLLNQPYFLHDQIKISFPEQTKDEKYIPVAYVWGKYPDCEVKGTEGTAKCCYW